MKPDGNREMYFVRNIEWLRNDAAPRETWEYEVRTDADIVGEMHLGPYYLSVWEIGFNKREGDDRRLCLRVKHRMTIGEDRPVGNADRSGFYHGGGIPDEIVALSSLALRRRLILGPVVRMDDMPRMFDQRGRGVNWIDAPVVTGRSNLEELKDWLSLVAGLRSEFHQRFILSTKLYHQALIMAEDNPEIAYLNLVSAIEVLSGDFDIGSVTVADRDRKLASMVDQIHDENLRRDIAQRIIGLERFTMRRFVEFILTHIEKEFWNDPERPELGRIEPNDLGRLLKRVYDQRSKTLHDGQPFPAFALRPPIQNEEIPFYNISQGERLWSESDYIPYFHFFERLVRHVMLNYLKQGQTT